MEACICSGSVCRSRDAVVDVTVVFLFRFLGGMVSSSVVPQVQAVFPQGALTKKIKVGLQVNLFKPRKGVKDKNLKKITVNNVSKKKRFSLIW